MAFEKHIVPDIPGLTWGERCANCTCETRVVPGDGPVPARCMLIGERPGQEEMFRNVRPLTGKAGRELNFNYLNLAGLTRDEVYFCNTVRCSHIKNQTPGKPLIDSCSRTFLPHELEAVNPTFLIPMGGTACHLFDGIELSKHHGMPIKRELFGRKYWVIPQFHPALGLHDTRKMTPMLEDWARLGKIINGTYRYPVDQYKNPDYRIAHGRRGVEDYLRPEHTMWLDYGGLDTETDASRLWCITVSIRPGTGILIMASDREAVNTFRELSNHYRWFIHNAIFDLDKLMEKNIHLKHVVCTMQGAYHRGNLPQGLKPLAWRLLGVEMTDYEDVVIPHSKSKLMDWWMNALLALDGDQVVTRRFSVKTGKELKSVIKPSKLFKRMLQIYNHGQKGTSTYDMWKKLDELDADDRSRILELVGHPPRPSIIHVPMESSEGIVGAKEYAVRDADIGRRLGLCLRAHERDIRRGMSTILTQST